MKIYTAKYKAEQPATKELHVPTYSKYGIGLQFERDGQPWDLKQSEVTLSGLSADDVVDGTFIFERTSGECGQKVSDVRAADMGVHVSGTEATSGTTGARVKSVNGTFQLSNILSEPVEVTYDQFQVLGRTISTDEFIDLKAADSSHALQLQITEQSAFTSGDMYLPYVQLNPSAKTFWYYPEGPSTSPRPAAYEVDKATFYPTGIINGYFRNVKGQYWTELSVAIDTADTVRNYKLIETTEDQGVVLGFNEKYVLNDTITLSGTNDDDTTFSYTLPTTN